MQDADGCYGLSFCDMGMLGNGMTWKRAGGWRSGASFGRCSWRDAQPDAFGKPQEEVHDEGKAVPGFHRQSLDIFRAYVLNGWNVLNSLNILMCVAGSSRVWCYELCGYHCEWMYASVSVRQCEEQSEGDPRAQYVKVLVKHGITPVPWLLWCSVFELSCLPACFWAINVSWVCVVVQCCWILLVRRARSSTQFCSNLLYWNNFLFCINFNLKLLRSFGRLAS